MQVLQKYICQNLSYPVTKAFLFAFKRKNMNLQFHINLWKFLVETAEL